MATQVLAMVRIVSVADNFKGRGVTEGMIQDVIGPIRPPEDKYHRLRPEITESKAHSHDSNWGYFVYQGDLLDYDDADFLRTWWVKLINAFNPTREDTAHYVTVVQGSLHVMIDGQKSFMMDHTMAWMEFAGSEE